MIVNKGSLPQNSILKDTKKAVDYIDSYSFETTNNNLSMSELYILIFSTTPKWVDYLLRLRNKIVSVFGLKTEEKKQTHANFSIGDKVGIFKMYAIQKNEIVAGEDDKHLNFRVSIYREVDLKTTVTVSTLVYYNNIFGKIYFAIVAPFHKLIVKSLLKNSANAINSQ